MNVVSVIAAAARTYPENIAISWIDRPLWNYRNLLDRAATLAAGLRARGLGPGDRVAMAMSNAPTYYEILLGAWIAGLVPAPQNCKLHPAEIAFAAADCEARLCFATQDLAPAVAAALAGRCPVVDVDSAEYATLHGHGSLDICPRQMTDPALLFYTSGTTGKPKGAVHTHRTLSAMLVSFLADSGSCIDDHVLHLAPLSHATGFIGLSYLARGRNNVILPTGTLDLELVRRAAATFRLVSLFAVPTVVRRLVNSALIDEPTVSRIHRVFFGGAPMYVDDLQNAIAKFGTERLWHLYGQGESPNTITHLPPRLFGTPDDRAYLSRLGSVGIPRSGVCVQILRGDGGLCGVDEVGEVAVQGDTLMSGYWNRPDATAAAIRKGWLLTGDLGRLGADGFLTLVDRSKDMIISGGSNIYPREIEEVLLTHPDVLECAVVGFPDDEWGERPIAFVVSTNKALTSEALDSHVLSQLARYKRPKAYRFIDELPKSAYGKVLKTELRVSHNQAIQRC